MGGTRDEKRGQHVDTRYGMGTARTQEISGTAENEVTRRLESMYRSNVDYHCLERDQ